MVKLPGLRKHSKSTNVVESRTYYSMLGSKNMYAKYQAFVLKGIDPVTEAFAAETVSQVCMAKRSSGKQCLMSGNFTRSQMGYHSSVAQRPEMEEIVSVVARMFSVSREEILEKRRGRQPINIPRQISIYCCQRVCGYAQQEVADCFSLTHRGSVSSSVTGN